MRKIFLLTLLACCMLLGAVAQAAQITDVKWGVNKADVLRIVVDVTDTAGYAVDMEGNTLNLTVNADKGAQVPHCKAVKSSLADSLKIVDKGSYTVVRVPLKQRLLEKSYKAFVLRKDPATGRPFRVVLDVTPRQASYSGYGAATTVVSNKPVVSNRPTKNNSSIKKNTVIKTSTAADKKADKKKSSSKKKNDNKKNTAAAKTETTVNKPVNKSDTDKLAVIKGNGRFRTSGGLDGKIITLDAGHGGSDPGAIGSDGTKEKNITLAITKIVKEILEDKGAKVYMTRTTDVDVFGPNASDAEELQARVNVGEKYNSDMFVSLHINSSVNKNVGGFSTYYYPKTDNDLRLAKNIQNKLAANFGVDDLGVRQANFYVIKRISMPAVLVEMCFISNEKELTLMKGQWFQKKTARLIAEGIEKYFA
ncbi:N-acetylmuramoyl-L-alanine amidase family protein [Phascolarctobacterium succinatutens]|uniref:N-acetylmuramoyl-L-alanine amidase family protein n=1 Tax=Phascolarctobacterium succinatutens TaxID=626940 RepID=UPI0027BA02E9|nr:N-acetylmuramoyl-L-alanine amidase [Phascolarctobacterium succinatutens]